MSLRLAAPYPTIQAISVIPNPEFSDVRKQVQSFEVRRSMNNTVRTYTKSSERRVFDYTVSMTRMKSLELRDFILSYFDSKILLTDHDGVRWIVYLTNNPFEFNGAGRAVDSPGQEYVTIQLQFEGEAA